MHLHSIKYMEHLYRIAMAMVKMDDSTRDELRGYKAEHGVTYDDAINRLLENSGWNDE